MSDTSNEIKPVGRGRDIQIAKAKGFDSYIDKDIACTTLRKSNGKQCIRIQPWSTNRNDAWELWDELPKAKFYEERCEGSYVITLKNIVVVGKDFVDCVSKAWLAWKGDYL